MVSECWSNLMAGVRCLNIEDNRSFKDYLSSLSAQVIVGEELFPKDLFRHGNDQGRRRKLF